MPSRKPPSPSSDSAAAQVRAYFAAQPPLVRQRLRAVRAAVRGAAPGAEDAFSYGIPAFKLDGQRLVWYAGWKEHVAMYPITAAMRNVLAAEATKYETSKGTVKFPLSRPLPLGLVKRLAKARVAEIQRPARRSRG